MRDGRCPSSGLPGPSPAPISRQVHHSAMPHFPCAETSRHCVALLALPRARASRFAAFSKMYFAVFGLLSGSVSSIRTCRCLAREGCSSNEPLHRCRPLHCVTLLHAGEAKHRHLHGRLWHHSNLPGCRLSGRYHGKSGPWISRAN